MNIQHERANPTMKQGANTIDQVKITRMAGEGYDSAFISQSLLITKEVVERFMPKVEEKPKTSKKKAKPAPEAQED